jgi:hypothetical protein
MKIYINNFNIEILSNIVKTIKEQYIDSETYLQIYSSDGIYQIGDNSFKKLNPTDADIKIYKNYYENFTLIIDPSYYTSETTYKIVPEHTSTKMKRCFYQINKNSDIKLVIEGPIEDASFTKKSTSVATSATSTDADMTPNDIYFEVENNIDINDIFIKKEIIVFLSLLN